MPLFAFETALSVLKNVILIVRFWLHCNILLFWIQIKRWVHGFPDKKWDHPIVFGPEEPWELKDRFVIEISPKNPSYPMAKRIVWMLKEDAPVNLLQGLVGWSRTIPTGDL